MHLTSYRALAALCCTLFALPATAQTVRSVLITEGFGTPTFVCMAPGDDTRLFVCSSAFGIALVKNNQRQPGMFLDLFGTLAVGQGLNGMAFDPDYATNGRFYIVYQDVDQDSWLVEYRVSADADVADPDSARVLLGPVPQPDLIHNWNCLAFGPDGMLYLGTGDGGFANDPLDNAQDLGSLSGKILRLDPDLPAPHIPADNPFVGVPGVRAEIWAYGLRQPWRISFDRLTGDLYIADVGEGKREEIDFQPAASTGGENYGWRCMEGRRCTQTGDCGCADPSWVLPIHEYPHTDGLCAVIGGHVYRGSALPELDGTYFYGDFCTGRIFSLRYDGSRVTEFQDRSQELASCGGATLSTPTSFGEDNQGELYITTLTGGKLLKLVPADRTSFTYCAGAPNSVGRGARIDHTGSTLIARNDFELTVRDAIPGQTGLFYYGPDQSQSPFGHGLRCVAGTIQRLHPAVRIAPDGSASRRVDLRQSSAGGEIVAGSSVSFQFWYRDPAAGAPGFNLSDALRVEFCE